VPHLGGSACEIVLPRFHEKSLDEQASHEDSIINNNNEIMNIKKNIY
jgi:hypothetical protein